MLLVCFLSILYTIYTLVPKPHWPYLPSLYPLYTLSYTLPYTLPYTLSSLYSFLYYILPYPTLYSIPYSTHSNPPYTIHYTNTIYRLNLPNPLLRPFRPSTTHDGRIIRPMYLHDDDIHSVIIQRYLSCPSPAPLYVQSSPVQDYIPHTQLRLKKRNTTRKTNRHSLSSILLPLHANLRCLRELYPMGIRARDPAAAR